MEKTMTKQEKIIFIQNRHILYDLDLLKGYTDHPKKEAKNDNIKVPFSSCHNTVDDYNRDVHIILDYAGDFKAIPEDIAHRVKQTKIELGELV